VADVDVLPDDLLQAVRRIRETMMRRRNGRMDWVVLMLNGCRALAAKPWLPRLISQVNDYGLKKIKG